jgi:protein kinase/serine/threonine-protein kinase
LGEIVARATQADPDERYPNATVMMQVLEAKDPTPPPAGTLTYLPTGEAYTVYPGDTVGRRHAEGPTPSIPLEDEEEYISTVQIQFELDDGGRWRVRDRSLNGTYVQAGEGWQRVLSEAGRGRLADLGEDPTDRNGETPPTTYPVDDGDVIALVHPSYGASLRFEVD